jgi:hypothetical protein
MPLSRSVVVALLLAVGVALAVGGCRDDAPPADAVARVGPYVLTEAEVRGTINGLSLRGDTAEARAQIVEQWVTRMLLYQEAQRRDLRREADVQRLLDEQERAVLVAALTDRLYETFEATPTDAKVRAYYDRHREQLRLREPVLRVRHMATRARADARTVRDAMQRAPTDAAADSLWDALAARYAVRPDAARATARTYRPLDRLLPHEPALRSELRVLDPGEWAPLVARDSLVHVLQLAERQPVGTLPPLAWVEGEIRRRLAIQARKQMYAREVQRLRNQAMARGQLDLP